MDKGEIEIFREALNFLLIVINFQVLSRESVNKYDREAFNNAVKRIEKDNV